jgi:hypothetical protein
MKTLKGKINRSESDWLFPAFFLVVFWFGALFVSLMVAEKSDNRVLIFALLVGLLFIVNLLRKLHVMSLLAFEPRAELVLPLSPITAGDDFEVLFRQRLKRNYTVSSIKLTLYAELIDKIENERRMAHIQELSPDGFLQDGKLVEARRNIHLPEELALSSEYKSLPVEWRILVSVKLLKGPKCISMFYLPMS